MDKQKLVLIGNGMAGIRCLEEILDMNPELFDITVFGKEPHVNYNRILLSGVLQGDHSFEDIILNDREWYAANSIRLFTGETVVKIDTETKSVKSDKNREVSYDKLIIATGSVPFILPVPGADKEGIMAFRTIEDCQEMLEVSKRYKKAAIIGGGLLGLEAARGLLNLGMEVKVVHLSDCLMERQLDRTASKMLEKELERQGMQFLLEKETDSILGDRRVEGVRFKDGTEIEADIVVMAAGVRPNVQIAKGSRIETNRAILVDDYLETNVPGVYAVGECAEHQGMVYGLVKPLYEQAQVLAKHICGIEGEAYKGSVLSTQLKISGVDVFSAGRFVEDERTQAVILQDDIHSVYKKLLFEGNRLAGALLFGDTSSGQKLLQWMLEKKSIADHEKTLLLQSSGIGEGEAASMLSSDIVCSCNAVTKGAVIEAVQQDGLTTIEEVRACTRASSSCGGCKPLVSDVLAYIQSDAFNEVVERPAFCSCTSLTEDEVVKEIQVRGLSTFQEITNALGWKQEEGCDGCRGALDYYLGIIHPDKEGLKESVVGGEHANASRQSDGTYIVTLPLRGGMTDAQQLKRMAGAAEKYHIKEISLSSGQRIHLIGVDQTVLPDLWKELELPLKPAGDHAVHSVETHISEGHCSCSKSTALHLAAHLEEQLECLKLPHRMKISVAACIHNGEEAVTKDIGFVHMNRGWEIYTGGRNGYKAKAGDLFYVAETIEEAKVMALSFIQYYRETANYLEKVSQWIQRMGMIHIREVVFEEELHNQLLRRLKEEVLYYNNTSMAESRN
ncbi:nitrite reductase large subunit NirB [Bacillus thermotolerans]|uniref:nitrite reductase large subunit NirB n=1 Tax=Bacillus thermotolerans TaxID=1221996 RepID=UPI000582DFCA|nr:nitrite reductase large subunit NirB [Bacillus thermotolerans]KKB34920.1 Nitrite reductase [NAD(P)H] large subunit [Bacillus thermotolerans]